MKEGSGTEVGRVTSVADLVLSDVELRQRGVGPQALGKRSGPVVAELVVAQIEVGQHPIDARAKGVSDRLAAHDADLLARDIDGCDLAD